MGTYLIYLPWQTKVCYILSFLHIVTVALSKNNIRVLVGVRAAAPDTDPDKWCFLLWHVNLSSPAASLRPLSSLRLLVPPLRLLTAAMWQVARHEMVKHYGMLEDFVSLVTEAIPQLLTDRQRCLLLLALRAKVGVLQGENVTPEFEGFMNYPIVPFSHLFLTHYVGWIRNNNFKR